MKTRLFGLYTLTVLALEGLGALAHVKILPAVGIALDIPTYQIGIAAAAVAIAAILGLVAGFTEFSILDEFGAGGITLSAVITGCAIFACASYGYDNVVAMIIAALAAGLLARLADFAIESIEINCYAKLGRY